MADTANKTLPTLGNPLFDIGTDVLELQARAGEALDLLSALDDATETMFVTLKPSLVGDGEYAEFNKALGKVMTFSRLATSAVEAAVGLGQRIETATMAPRSGATAAIVSGDVQ